jgi:hypothetical protein
MTNPSEPLATRNATRNSAEGRRRAVLRSRCGGAASRACSTAAWSLCRRGASAARPSPSPHPSRRGLSSTCDASRAVSGQPRSARPSSGPARGSPSRLLAAARASAVARVNVTTARRGEYEIVVLGAIGLVRDEHFEQVLTERRHLCPGAARTWRGGRARGGNPWGLAGQCGVCDPGALNSDRMEA